VMFFLHGQVTAELVCTHTFAFDPRNAVDTSYDYRSKEQLPLVHFAESGIDEIVVMFPSVNASNTLVNNVHIHPEGQNHTVQKAVAVVVVAAVVVIPAAADDDDAEVG